MKVARFSPFSWLAVVLILLSTPIFGQTSVPILFPERDNIARTNQLVSFNFPLPEAAGITDLAGMFSIRDPSNTPIPAQLAVKSRWKGEVSDTTKPIKWVHVSIPVTVGALANAQYSTMYGVGAGSPPAPATSVSITQNGNIYTVNTGAASYTLNSQTFNLIDSVSVGGQLFTTLSQNDGVTLTEKDVVRLDGSAAQSSTSLTVTDASQFSPNDQIDITLRELTTNSASANQNYILIPGPGNAFRINDVITIAKGNPSREEIRTITNVEPGLNPNSWTPAGTFNAEKLTLSAPLSNNHPSRDLIEKNGVITMTVQQVPPDTVGGHTLTLSSALPRSLRIGTKIQKSGATVDVYSPKTTPPTQFTVEENGPLRAVIYVKGYNKNSAGTQLLEYEARLYFEAGDPSVKVDLTRRNPNSYGYFFPVTPYLNKDLYLHSFDVDIPFTASATAATFDTSRGDKSNDLQSFTTALSPGDTVRQIIDMKLPSADASGYNFEGDQTTGNLTDNFYGTIKKNGATLYSAGGNVYNSNYLPYGILKLGDGTKSLFIGIKDFWQRFPKAITATPQKLKLEFLPNDIIYGPRKNGDGASIDSYNQQAGTRELVTFVLYPANGDAAFNTVRDKLRSKLHKPLYPVFTQHLFATKALFEVPYAPRQNWNDPLLGLSAQKIQEYNRFEKWVDVILLDTAAENSFGSWQRRFKNGFEYGVSQSWGAPNEGAVVWADGYTQDYDPATGTIIQFARTGDTRYLDFAEPMVTERTFYRQHYADLGQEKWFGYLQEVYEKGYRHKDFEYPAQSHSWYMGLAYGCLMLDNQWSCDLLEKWADEKFTQATAPSPNDYWTNGCSTTPRAHGWMARGGVAAYSLFGKPEYLTTLRNLYIQYANCDLNQAGGPRGFIVGGFDGQSDAHNVWMTGIFWLAGSEYLLHDPNPPQIVVDMAKRWADFISGVTPYPAGLPYQGGGPDNDFLNYRVCNGYSMTAGCMSPKAVANTPYLAAPLAQIYLALNPLGQSNEQWADVARDMTESATKFNNVYGSVNCGAQTIGRVLRYGPNCFGQVDGRVSAYFNTAYKSQYPIYTYLPISQFIELYVRKTCNELGGNFCTSSQVCTGTLSVAKDSNGQQTCCIPATGGQGCIADVTPPSLSNLLLSTPIISNVPATTPLHVSTTQFTLQFITNEESECRYETIGSGATFTTMNPANIFTTADGITHQKTFNDYNGAAINYPQGGSLVFYVSCSDTPLPGNAMPTQTITVTINPPDSTPPIITLVQAVASDTSVTVSWITDEPSDTMLSVQGAPPDIYQAELVMTHSTTKTNLLPSTPYSFTITSKDYDNNPASQTGSFLTQNALISQTISPPSSSIAGIAQGANNGLDTYQSMQVGYSGWLQNTRGIAYFPLTGIPPNIANLNAHLLLTIGSLTPSSTGQTQTVEVYPLLQQAGFSQGGVGPSKTGSSNWQKAIHPAPAWSSTGGTYDTSFTPLINTFPATPGTVIDIDASSLVSYWLTNTNYGLLIKASTGTTPIVTFNNAALSITGETIPPTCPSTTCNSYATQQTCESNPCGISCTWNILSNSCVPTSTCTGQICSCAAISGCGSYTTQNDCTQNVCTINPGCVWSNSQNICSSATICNNGVCICTASSSCSDYSSENDCIQNPCSISPICVWYPQQNTCLPQPQSAPLFTLPSTLTTNEGRMFSYTIQANSPSVVTFSAAGLPPGAQLSTDGILTWNLAGSFDAQGNYPITISATDGTQTTSVSTTITVLDCDVASGTLQWANNNGVPYPSNTILPVGTTIQVHFADDQTPGKSCEGTLMQIDLLEDDSPFGGLEGTGIQLPSFTINSGQGTATWQTTRQIDTNNFWGDPDPEYVGQAHPVGQTTPPLTTNTAYYLKITEADNDLDSVSDLPDCNDNDPLIGECTGCAECSDPTGNAGVCEAPPQNPCGPLTCLQGPLALCGSSGCNQLEVPQYPTTEPQTCTVNGNNGVCAPQSCTALSCVPEPECDVLTADEDGDSVPNYNDLCPGTPPGQAVNVYGQPRPIATEFASYAGTTDMTTQDLSNVNLILETPYARITWDNPLNLVSNNALPASSPCEPTNLDNAVSMTNAQVGIDATTTPQLNAAATVETTNINLINPVVSVGGQPCLAPDCTIINYQYGIFTFHVNNW